MALCILLWWRAHQLCRDECSLAEWAVVSAVAAQLMHLLLISIMSISVLVPHNESLNCGLPCLEKS